MTAKSVAKDKMKGRHMTAIRAGSHRHLKGKPDHGCCPKRISAWPRVMPHAVIKHSDWYVVGDIHTNTIEGFWALLKRGMFGQFHSVSGRHLQRYVDEFCYRYNLRKTDPFAAFELTINRGLGVTQSSSRH